MKGAALGAAAPWLALLGYSQTRLCGGNSSALRAASRTRSFTGGVTRRWVKIALRAGEGRGKKRANLHSQKVPVRFPLFASVNHGPLPFGAYGNPVYNAVMSIDKRTLTAHLEDYFRVTGRRVGRFVCPITLRECDDGELVSGHILNGAILSASRRRVVQYGALDHFYGTRVEPGLVRYLNLRDKSGLDVVKGGGKLRVRLPDGSQVEGFLADSPAARNAEGHFPRVGLVQDGRTVASVYLKMPSSLPVIEGAIEVTKTEVFAPYDWVAALLKAGYLALFDMLGYTIVSDPYGDTIRRSLNQFFQDRARTEDAPQYFRDFGNAVKVIGARYQGGPRESGESAFPFDTLDNREVFLHHTPSGSIFAATCIFKVNGATIAVTLPQSTPGTDPALVLDWYKGCTENPVSRRQLVHRARFEGTAWRREGKPLEFGILAQSGAV